MKNREEGFVEIFGMIVVTLLTIGIAMASFFTVYNNIIVELFDIPRISILTSLAVILLFKYILMSVSGDKK